MEWLTAMAAQLPDAEGRTAGDREAERQARNEAVLTV
jgi:transcription-repair coupling factor (superfamily II helicase)